MASEGRKTEKGMDWFTILSWCVVAHFIVLCGGFLWLVLAKKRDAAILMVNHFIDLVERVSDQVILLDRDHQAALVGSPAQLLRNRGRVV